MQRNKYKKFVCFHSNGTPYDFNNFRDIKQLGNYIFNGLISIKDAKDEQDKMKEEMAKLENYNPINKKKVDTRNEVLNNAKKLFDIKSRIIKAFEDGIFPLHKENLHKEQAEEKKKRRKKRKNNP